MGRKAGKDSAEGLVHGGGHRKKQPDDAVIVAIIEGSRPDRLAKWIAAYERLSRVQKGKAGDSADMP